MSNKTILYLHGWATNYKYMEPLAINYKHNHLLIDLPCFGKNKNQPKPLTLMDYKNQIIDFILKNNYHIELIVGHSFGGKIAPLIAKELKVKNLILLSPSIFNKPRMPSYYFKVFVYKVIKKITNSQKILSLFGSKDYKSLNSTMKKTMSNIVNCSIKNIIIKLDAKVILIFSNKDKITPYYLGKKIKKYIKNSVLIKINGDHFAYLNNIGYINSIIEKAVD